MADLGTTNMWLAIMAIVAVWLIAAAVIGMRQALDYRSTARAIAVCTLSLILSLALLAGGAMLLSVRVS